MLESEITNQYRETIDGNSRLEAVLSNTAERLGIDPEEFLGGLLKYDAEHGTYDNRIYADSTVRGALYLKYFVEDSYHVKRQEILSDLVSKVKGNTFVDIGYGAPGLYVEDYIIPNKKELTLLDKFNSASEFSDALLSSITDTDWKSHITLGEYDFDTLKSPGSFDTYILFDSIEHAKDPTNSFQAIIDSAPDGANFLLSLPIGPADEAGGSADEPVHFIEWLTAEEIIDWVKSFNLSIEESQELKLMKGDLWSESGNFSNLIIWAKK
jgi:hypothetical protein